ncbi:DHS-like NAD/FAD-binding domain-containing protein [Glomus cerebriforme]|uniref:DHS-like NAD/FAD-binding domain-containing protein n=1 Tax=Glomus cerebriforme TaxID=658196 RepID=A0A397SFB2_9GLOM|nr:DHS-like NAD/FAD-binding domain-containing protein [Glomus cerebriforme]
MRIFVPIRIAPVIVDSLNIKSDIIKPTSSTEAIQRITEFFKASDGKLLVLTGAGVSTDSGIPDYRGPQGTYIINKNYKPIFYHEFAGQHRFRQRYWARSFLGWPSIQKANPNSSHFAFARLQSLGYIQDLITQNVDKLHQKAGTKNILELHGTLHEVHCMQCGHIQKRSNYQHVLNELNPKWEEFLNQIESFKIKPKVRPDGDVDLPSNTSYETFNYPSCEQCKKGIYKPSIIFFGENIKSSVKLLASNMVDNCNAMMVVGSTLATYSAFRLVKSAYDSGKNVAIINFGETKGDNLAWLKIERLCGDILPLIFKQITK